MFVSVMGRFRNKQASLVPSITRLTHVQHTVGLVEDKVRWMKENFDMIRTIPVLLGRDIGRRECVE